MKLYNKEGKQIDLDNLSEDSIYYLEDSYDSYRDPRSKKMYSFTAYVKYITKVSSFINDTMTLRRFLILSISNDKEYGIGRVLERSETDADIIIKEV